MRFVRNPDAAILGACLLAVAANLMVPCAMAVPWHHGKSPFRAEFEIVSKPNHARAGTSVSVPLCALGNVEGLDLVGFDERGNHLPMFPLGRSVNNEAIALVKPTADSERIFVYFGSWSRAPVNKRAFLPSLTVDVRTLPDMPVGNGKQVEAALAKSERLGRLFVENVELSHNPVDSADACILVFEGYLNVSRAGAQTFMLVSDDAGYLFVDDELLVARDGKHWARDAVRGQSRNTVALTAEPHPFRCVVVDMGGQLMAVVARYRDERNKATLQAADFLQPGRTRLLNLEPRYADKALPAFWSRPLSYMGYEGVQYTEVEFGTYNKKEAVWEFSDGAKLEADTFKKIFVGLNTQRVRVTQRGVAAEGEVTFPESPPRRRPLGRPAEFKHYTALLLDQNLADMKVSVLRGAVHFLKYRPLNPDVVPFCEAILKHRNVDADVAAAALLDLARCAARQFPDKANAAYRELLDRGRRRSDWSDLARECAEFAIYRIRDLDLARNVIAGLRRKVGARDPRGIGLALDLALQSGDLEGAQARLAELLGSRDMGKNQRLIAVRSRALERSYRDLFERGSFLEARRELWAWLDLSPADRANGSLPLARARFWKATGWLEGALAELDAAARLNPLLPNLPDVELERAQLQGATGRAEASRELLARIVEEYPNHPVAARARELLK